MNFPKLKRDELIRNVRGFTLIEMLVAMAIVGMMMSAVYAVHIANVRAVSIEEERVEIQQDQRISLDFVTRELRMAGYDKAESGLPKIEDARSNFIYYTADFNDDDDVNDEGEHIAFCVFNSPDFGRTLSYITGSDSSVGGIGSAVATPGQIPEAHTHNDTVLKPHQAFAPIEDIEFFYSYYDSITDTIIQTLTPTAAQFSDIRSVEITILSRADTPDIRFQHNGTYTTPGGQVWGPYLDANGNGDNTRRRMMTANIRFRNLGL